MSSDERTPAEHHREIRQARAKWARTPIPEEPRRVKLSAATTQDHVDSVARRRGTPTVEIIDDSGEAA